MSADRGIQRRGSPALCEPRGPIACATAVSWHESLQRRRASGSQVAAEHADVAAAVKNNMPEQSSLFQFKLPCGAKSGADN